jgi:transposase-like protein/Zn ribbon nucleic-acid-binding protein
MKEYPMTFEEFTVKFATEEQCRQYLYQLRFPSGFVCPKCTNSKAWPIGGTLFECSKCGHQTSVIAGTIFQDTRTPLKAWFTAIWWITTQKNGASAIGLQQILGLKSYKTAWTWLHKIRKAMVYPNRTKLCGTVEVDEAYIGGEEHGGKTGRGTKNKSLVAVAIELGDKGHLGRARLAIIPDASKKSLQNFIGNNVEKGSTIISDGWKSYASLSSWGYEHVVHTKKDIQNEDELLPNVHRIISLLKRWLLGTHQGAVRRKHLQAYLDEYVFRFNRRKSAQRGLLFYRLLECTMLVPPITLRELFEYNSQIKP